MAWVYIIRGSSGRYYIGSTENLERRLAEHHRGSNHTTRRFGGNIELVIALEMMSIAAARTLELKLKPKKTRNLRSNCCNASDQKNKSSPQRLSGLVLGSSPSRPSSPQV